MKIAIVAGSYGKDEAPLGDPNWECWGVNQTWSWFNHEALQNKFTRWFELHRKAFLEWENQADRYGQHFSFMESQKRYPTLYVQDIEEWPAVENIKEFPFERVQALAPDFGSYHACSIDWMLAYAILEGASEIGLYGVEQDHTAEPIGSRACMEFWAGFATARGIKVHSAQGSTFKLAHLVYTNTPYALDPLWLPFEDRTNGEKTYLGKVHAELARTVEKARRRD